MIIVSVTGPAMETALQQLTGSSGYADLFELRLDRVRNPDLARLFAAATGPVVATCRSASEGGAFTGSEQERVNILAAASRLGAAFIDFELSADRPAREELLRRSGDSRLIVSHHLTEGKPFNVRTIYKKLRDTGADVVKFAFPATDACDNAHAFEFLALAKADRQHAVAIAMGEAGEPSRILYRKYGGWATYAAPEDGSSAAPGQICASDMKKVYRTHLITPKTKVFGVVGQPLGQSKGIYVHNELFRRAGINAVYCRFSVNDLHSFMEKIGPHLHGFSVTIPHKEGIMYHLDRVEPLAAKIGAVNTVIRRSGNLVGSNTDAGAALDAIESVSRVRGKTVLVLGAGGAARAIVYEAVRRGAEVVVANRTPAKAEKLARELRVTAIPMDRIRTVRFDILANATSVGMVPGPAASPVPADILAGKTVFDAVYNPPLTALLEQASAAGATTISGVEMYVNQAAKQSALFAGKRPDITVLRRVLTSHLE